MFNLMGILLQVYETIIREIVLKESIIEILAEKEDAVL